MKSEDHYRIHKSLLTVPVLNQIDLVRAFSNHFSKIHFNIILPPMPVFSKWSSFLSFFPPNALFPGSCYDNINKNNYFNCEVFE
jgi:hypothetical protein